MIIATLLEGLTIIGIIGICAIPAGLLFIIEKKRGNKND